MNVMGRNTQSINAKFRNLSHGSVSVARTERKRGSKGTSPKSVYPVRAYALTQMHGAVATFVQNVQLGQQKLELLLRCTLR